MKCKLCSKSVSDGVDCGGCRGQFHFECIGVPETTYRKMNVDRRAGVRCPQCRANHQDSQGSSAILEELRGFRAEFSSTKSQIQHISTSIDAINTKWNEMETRFSDLEDRIIALEGSASVLSRLQSELAVGTQTIHNLQNELQTRDQHARINNIEISGIPFKKGENLLTILDSIHQKVGLKLETSEVDSIHRVRRFAYKNIGRDVHGTNSDSTETGARIEGASVKEPRPPAIIVHFTRRLCKDRLLAAVRARRGLTTTDIGLDGPALAIFLSDHLTPTNKMLLKRARERKAQLHYAYLWTRDCKILMRKNDTSKIVGINNDTDLLKLK
jgi:prefoldin subunit 5